MSGKSLTPEEEQFLIKSTQLEFNKFVSKKGFTENEQWILIQNIGRKNLISHIPSTAGPPPIVLAKNSIYEHYLNSLNPSRSKPLRIEIEKCKTRMNHRELRPAQFSSNQLQNYGLVVGRIQSGKTAHLIGMALACLSDQSSFQNPELRRKLPSASVVIIFTGLIDDLRKQTYDRFCNDIAGYDHSLMIVGPEREKDLTKDSRFQNKIQSFFQKRPLTNNDLPNQLVLILKKNHKVIECLSGILENIERPAKRRLQDVIIIDDECDYASMDSNNADQNIKETETTTNLRLRELICLFRNEKKFRTICWYIGYTATPFSNVLVNPHGRGTNNMPTLFPRGFIYPIAKVPVHLDNEFYFNHDDGKKHIFLFDNLLSQKEEEE